MVVETIREFNATHDSQWIKFRDEEKYPTRWKTFDSAISFRPGKEWEMANERIMNESITTFSNGVEHGNTILEIARLRRKSYEDSTRFNMHCVGLVCSALFFLTFALTLYVVQSKRRREREPVVNEFETRWDSIENCKIAYHFPSRQWKKEIERKKRGMGGLCEEEVEVCVAKAIHIATHSASVRKYGSYECCAWACIYSAVYGY